MKTLRNTDKPLSLANVAKEIDWNNHCQINYFGKFCNALITDYKSPETHWFLRAGTWLMKQNFMKSNEVETWLVEHGFAEWEEEFEPFDLRIETDREARLLWHRLNQHPKGISREQYRLWQRLNKLMEERGLK